MVYSEKPIAVWDANREDSITISEDKVDALEGIYRGLADLKTGRTTTADEFFDEFFSQHIQPL